MTARIDLLFFVEDPNAAGYVALLLPELAKRGRSTQLCAASVAADFLRARGIDFLECGPLTDAGTLLDQKRPKCVVVGTAENPDTLGLNLIAAARMRGIASIGFVDSRMNSEYRFRGRTNDPLAYAPDWLLAPDEWTLNAFVSLGFPQDHIEVCEHPQYDVVRDLARQWSRTGRAAFRGRIFPDLAPQRKIFVFVSDGSLRYDLLPSPSLVGYTLEGRGVNKGRTNIVLEEVLDAMIDTNPRPYFVLRLHPTDNVSDYAEYRNEIDRISCDGSALELVYASDVIVGMTSALLLEAKLLGKQILSIVPRETERDWLPGIESGTIPCASSREQLKQSLEYLLRDEIRLSPIINYPEIDRGAICQNVDYIDARLHQT